MKINENPMCVVCFPAAISGSDCPQVLSCNSALEMVWHRFIAKLRAVVKQCWEILFGSSDQVQEVQDIGKDCGSPGADCGSPADAKFPSYNNDCLEVRGKVYRH